MNAQIVEAIKSLNSTLEKLLMENKPENKPEPDFNNLIFIDNISYITNDTQSRPRRWILCLTRDSHTYCKYCWLNDEELAKLLQSGRLGIPKERFI